MNRKIERHCSLIEYLFRRIFSSLLYSCIYRRIHPHYPFYAPGAIRRIRSLLSKDSRVFEWGSGASTLWFAKHVKEAISVEHNREWYEKGLINIEHNTINNVKLFYSPPLDMDFIAFQNEWKYYNLLGHPPRKPMFYNYMRVIDQYSDLYFDCIAIDGRERVGCLVHAMPKLSQNGFIILDDSFRSKYKEFFDILSDWRTEKYDFGILQTTLFFRK